MTSAAPILFVVGTPIGNLEDLSLRAVRILRETDIIACEDTRKTLILLRKHAISSKRLISCHKYNEAKRVDEFLRFLREGNSVALVSNAGMPGISDPGDRLLRAAVEAGIRVEVIPGPSSLTAALSVSLLPRDEFLFCGFIPSRPVARKKKFFTLRNEPRTMVFFETANRLDNSLADMSAVFGDRKVEIARELTKIHEEVIRTSLSQSPAVLRDKTIKGEIVLIVEGATATEELSPVGLGDEVRQLMEELRISKSEAVTLVASARGVRKQQIYRELTGRRESGGDPSSRS
jgi:16S rRNA (cytidine1402-2'-O)-methyltransferase